METEEAKKKRVQTLVAAEREYLTSAGWQLSEDGSANPYGIVWIHPTGIHPKMEWDHDEALEYQKMMDGI